LAVNIGCSLLVVVFNCGLWFLLWVVSCWLWVLSCECLVVDGWFNFLMMVVFC
jgi:hypothetical protein